MPYPAMRQTIRVHRPAGRADWGKTVPGEVLEYPCRVDDKTQTVANQYGEEAVSSAEIMLWKFVDIRYDDTIEYTNEYGETIKRKPVRIEPMRWFNGKPRYTVVFV